MRSFDQLCAQINVGIDLSQSSLKISLVVFYAGTEGDTFTSSKRQNTTGRKALFIALYQARESICNVLELFSFHVYWRLEND